MSNQIIGRLIGRQYIISGNRIIPKTPSGFNPPFPVPSSEIYGNILFEAWQIKTNPYHGILIENVPYTYGTNLKVQALWYRKVQTHIWCEASQSQAVADLSQYVTVREGVQSGINQYGYYAFFADTDTATFDVDCDFNKIVTVNNRAYTFVGWMSNAPSLYSTILWDSFEPSYMLYPIQFNQAQVKDEWAVFIEGAKCEICVHINIEKFNNVSFYNYMFDYTLYGNRTESKMYHTNPPIVTNPWISVPLADFGNRFKCKIHQRVLENTYTFVGWYYGYWEYSDGIPGSEYLITTAEEEETPYINIIQNSITITAVYMPTDNLYTITYYKNNGD